MRGPLAVALLLALGCSGILSEPDTVLVGWASEDGRLRTLLLSDAELRAADHLVVPTAAGAVRLQSVNVAADRDCGKALVSLERSALVRADTAEALKTAFAAKRESLVPSEEDMACPKHGHSTGQFANERLVWVTTDALATEVSSGGWEEEGGTFEERLAHVAQWEGETWLPPQSVREPTEASVRAKAGEMAADGELVWIPHRVDGQTVFAAQLWVPDGVEPMVFLEAATGDGSIAEAGNPAPDRNTVKDCADWSTGPGGSVLCARGDRVGWVGTEHEVGTGRLVMVRWAGDAAEAENWRILLGAEP